MSVGLMDSWRIEVKAGEAHSPAGFGNSSTLGRNHKEFTFFFLKNRNKKSHVITVVKSQNYLGTLYKDIL